MQNLDQIRAKAAISLIKEKQDLKRGAISRLPALIINNGLLAAAAFAEANGGGDNKEHLKAAMKGVARHLADRGITRTDARTTPEMLDSLSRAKSSTLQRATHEALAYISFLKRFANPS